MKYKNIFQIVVFLLLLNVQNIAQFKGDVDAKFKDARELAFSGNRTDAIAICQNILEYYPNYDDVRLFLGRIFLWEKDLDRARAILINGKNKDTDGFTNLYLDIELQAKDYKKVIDIANKNLSNSPNNEDFLYKKAVAQNNLGNIKGAGENINRVLNLNPSHKKALSMQNLIEIAGNKNSISLNHNLKIFDTKFDSWNLTSFDLSRKFSFGSLILRLNYASRFNKEGYQFETDGYLRLLDGIYSYINFGYSPTNLFPGFRFGIEPYFKLPFSMEISVGYRYLVFGDKHVNLFTGHLGKYVGNYWISVRPFISPKTNSTGVSGIVIIRRYFSDSDNFISLQGGIGFAPSSEFNESELLKFDSKKIGVEYQTTFSKYYIIKSGFQFANEEYYPGKWRKSYEIKLGLKRRF